MFRATSSSSTWLISVCRKKATPANIIATITTNKKTFPTSEAINSFVSLNNKFKHIFSSSRF